VVRETHELFMRTRATGKCYLRLPVGQLVNDSRRRPRSGVGKGLRPPGRSAVLKARRRVRVGGGAGQALGAGRLAALVFSIEYACSRAVGPVHVHVTEWPGQLTTVRTVRRSTIAKHTCDRGIEDSPDSPALLQLAHLVLPVGNKGHRE